jgi:hypothetical protein
MLGGQQVVSYRGLRIFSPVAGSDPSGAKSAQFEAMKAFFYRYRANQDKRHLWKAFSHARHESDFSRSL